MFSSRTRWLRQPNRLSLRLAALRRTGTKILDLTSSNPTQAGFDYPSREIREALTSTDFLDYEPDPRGLPAARAAIARYYAEKGLQVDPAAILLTSGSSEAYAFLFRLLCEPGDTVLVPSPSYPLYDYIAGLSDVRILPYRLLYDGEWHLNMDLLLRAVIPSTRAIVMVHPNNPTGTFLKTAELEQVAAFAAERKMALIVDEVFIDYPLTHDGRRARSTAAFSDVLTCTINGLSKTAALPQVKLGWMAVSGPADQAGEALDRLEIIADTFLSVNTPVQHALPRLLQLGAGVRRQIASRTERNLGRLLEQVHRMPLCSLLHVEGGWYATLRVPATRTDEEWALALLDEGGVYAYPGFFFDFRGGGHLVISLLATEADLDSGVEAMVQVFNGTA
jgi:alanine-synthesizing transaminase